MLLHLGYEFPTNRIKQKQKKTLKRKLKLNYGTKKKKTTKKNYNTPMYSLSRLRIKNASTIQHGKRKIENPSIVFHTNCRPHHYSVLHTNFAQTTFKALLKNVYDQRQY